MKENVFKGQYNILTINGFSLLKNNKIIKYGSKYKIEYQLNFSKDILGDKVDNIAVKAENEYDENAMTFQIRQVLEEKGITTQQLRNEMNKTLVYVDFSDIFRSKKIDVNDSTIYDKTESQLKNAHNSLKLKFLFDSCIGGFDIKYDNDEIRHYTPFDKSNSMSKENKISFIDESIRKEVNERLQLDIDFKKLNMNLSKYYSYRGLYMSNGERIEQNDDFVLNEDTVIVVSDSAHIKLLNTETITNSEDYKSTEFSNRKVSRKSEKDNQDKMLVIQTKDEKGNVSESKETSKNYSSDVFDGEGIISPKYINFVNAQLAAVYHKRGKATSIQIRLPFSKGVLHEVDFHKFFKEEVNRPNITIKDYFGIERDLNKAQIIMTHGMFKIAKSLKTLFSDTDEDPMKYYFDKVREYKHSLYICNTFENFGYGKFVEMNYQFLNTLDLNDEQFKELITNSVENTKKILKEKYIDNENYSNVIQQKGDVFLQAISKNKNFIKTDRIKSYIENDYRRGINNIYDGKLYVSGEQRVFSRDLLALLVCIVEDSNVSEDKEVMKHINYLHDTYCLYPTKFYMPKSKKGVQLKHDSYYAFLRSPHLSRNEECLLSARVPNEKFEFIDKYFGHLTSIVMIGKHSIAPEILGGADFDGDEVKIVTDKIIVDAIKNSVYEKVVNPIFKDKQITNKNAERYYVYTERKIPVANITPFKDSSIDVTGKEESGYQETIPYEVIVNTFSNQVGLISNLAIKLSRKAYKKKGHENDCAKCTIVTGLEIDAGKTGKHPTEYINKLLKEAKVMSSAKKKKDKTNQNIDYYLDTNKKIDKMLEDINNNYYRKMKIDINENNSVMYSYSKKHSSEAINLKNHQQIYSDNDKINIDYLPIEYAKYIKEVEKTSKDNYELLKESVKEESSKCFDFEEGENWKQKLKNSNEEKYKQVQDILKAYSSVKKSIQRLESYKENFEKRENALKYKDKIQDILMNQYGVLKGSEKYNKLSNDFIELDEHLKCYFELSDMEDVAIEAHKKYFTSKWSYTKNSDKEQKLYEILGKGSEVYISDSDKNLLFNFDKGGNTILLYFLEHFKNLSIVGNKEEELKIVTNGNNPNFEKLKREFFELYENYDLRKEELTSKQKLLSELKKKLANIFSEVDYEELKYVWAITPNLIGEVLDNEQILSHVYMEGKNKNVG